MPHATEPALACRSSLLVADGLRWQTPLNEALFQDVTFSVGRERVGLVGRNGCGKTTLARLLAGELRPQRGTVARYGSIALLPQTADAISARTVAQALGVERKLEALQRLESGCGSTDDLAALDDDWTIAERTRAQLDRLGLAAVRLDAPVPSLSGGELTRVMLASLLLREPDVLLLDEPTNNLDAPARQALYRLVREWTGGLLVITHDRALLALVDSILELTPRGVRAYGGNFALYEEQRAREEQAAHRQLDEASRALRRVKLDAQRARERQERRLSSGRRSRRNNSQSNMILNTLRDRAQKTGSGLSRQAGQRVESAREHLRQARQRVEDLPKLDIDLSPVDLPAQKLVVALHHIGYRYPGGKPLLERISLKLTGPARVGIVGPNGSGKTTLLRLIAGELEPTSGRIDRGVERISYLDQHAALLDPSRSILDNFRSASPDMDETRCRQTLARFLFRGEMVHRTPDTLSGGERLRAALAVVLVAVHPPHCLLLDEPTNHLDLESLENLEAALRSYRGAIAVVSHDATFLDRIGCEERVLLDANC